jgi:hypothetical protein
MNSVFKPYLGVGLEYQDTGNHISGPFFNQIIQKANNINLQIGLRLGKYFGLQLDYFRTKQFNQYILKDVNISDTTGRLMFYYPIFKIFGTGLEFVGSAGLSKYSQKTNINTREQFIPKIGGGVQFMFVGKFSTNIMVDYPIEKPSLIKQGKQPLFYRLSFQYYLL